MKSSYLYIWCGNSALIGIADELQDRERRLRLTDRKQPYWVALGAGEHLGYYKGRRARMWVARFRRPGPKSRYQEITIAQADDFDSANGGRVLNFCQAREVARCRIASG